MNILFWYTPILPSMYVTYYFDADGILHRKLREPQGERS